MSEREIQKMIKQIDEIPLPPKEKILAACEKTFDEIPKQKTKKSAFKPIVIKKRVLQYAALAACLCLLITGVFGGLRLWGQDQTVPEIPGVSAPPTQKGPDLPIGSYPPVDEQYENMSMVEYMELHPDFLSYRYMPWEENFAFAHLEILWVEEGYRKIATLRTDGTYNYKDDERNPPKNSDYKYMIVKCRVIKDYWNKLEEGSEISFFMLPDTSFPSHEYPSRYLEDGSTMKLLQSMSTMLLRLEVKKGCRIFESKEKATVVTDGICEYLDRLGCFPIIDNRISLEPMKTYIGNRTPWYDIASDSKAMHCSFLDVEKIVADGMPLEMAGENLSTVYEKYQTGEYNDLSVELVSKMNYGEYTRMIEGTSTEEDFKKFGFSFKNAYAGLPPLYSVVFTLPDGTPFEFRTRVELSEEWEEYLSNLDYMQMAVERGCFDENGNLNMEHFNDCVDGYGSYYSLLILLGTEPKDFE